MLVVDLEAGTSPDEDNREEKDIDDAEEDGKMEPKLIEI